MDNMNDIISVILNHFQDTLVSLHLESRLARISMGSPPKVLIVEQKTPSGHEHFNTGETIQQWKITQDKIEGLAPDHLIGTERKINGMYYDYGRGDFCIRDGGKTARISWQIGPRYGRGFDFRIEIGGGSVKLVDQKPLWIS